MYPPLEGEFMQSARMSIYYPNWVKSAIKSKFYVLTWRKFGIDPRTHPS